MPDRITFTSIRLEKFARAKQEGSATFSCAWNQKVASAMDWPGDIPEPLIGSQLEGVLNASTCEISPSKSELKKHSFEIAGATIKDFETVRREIEGKKDKGHRTELRFKVKFSDPNGMKKLEQWWNSVGEEKGSLTVSYVRQEALPLDPAAIDATRPEADATFQ